MKVRKAVIAAAGYGTRFLPATKAVSKELFPIYDKPTLQYVVEELSEAGIEEIFIILCRGKEMIMNHFDMNYELETELKRKNKLDLLQKAEKPGKLAKITYIRAREMKGFADAIYQAKEFCNGEPFIVAVGDELMFEGNSFTELINAYYEHNKIVLCAKSMPIEEVKKYGVIAGEKINDTTMLVTDFVEKPSNPPSNIVSTGRYVFDSNIFTEIEKLYPKTKEGEEVLLPEAVKNLAKQNKVIALDVSTVRFDTGDKLGFVKANLYVALKDESIKEELKNYLKELIKD